VSQSRQVRWAAKLLTKEERGASRRTAAKLYSQDVAKPPAFERYVMAVTDR
jgi:hypothetical protein